MTEKEPPTLYIELWRMGFDAEQIRALIRLANSLAAQGIQADPLVLGRIASTPMTEKEAARICDEMGIEMAFMTQP